MSRKVWTSFGVGRVILNNFWPVETLSLQQLNRFWYTSAIGRVQTQIYLCEDPLYFTFSVSRLFEQTLFQTSGRNVVPITVWKNEIFDFKGLYTVQVERDLFGFKTGMQVSSFVKYSGLSHR